MTISRHIIYFGAALLGASTLAGAAIAETRSAAELQHSRVVDTLSVVELEQRMANGDLHAQAELGARYGRGDGVPANLTKSLELLRDAAEKKDPDAAFYLGLIHQTGIGVPKDEARAVLFYETAADQGHPAAQYMLGKMIYQGEGGIQASWESAFTYFWHAADSGYPPAELMLGYAYQMGYGTPRNPKAAAYWYRRNNSRGRNAVAEQNLIKLIANREILWEPGDPGAGGPPPLETIAVDAPPPPKSHKPKSK